MPFLQSFCEPNFVSEGMEMKTFQDVKNFRSFLVFFLDNCREYNRLSIADENLCWQMSTPCLMQSHLKGKEKHFLKSKAEINQIMRNFLLTIIRSESLLIN